MRHVQFPGLRNAHELGLLGGGIGHFHGGGEDYINVLLLKSFPVPKILLNFVLYNKY
jgi:hypothetical protein